MLKTKTNFPCTSLSRKAAGILRICLVCWQYGNLHKLWHAVREQLVKSFCRTVELLLRKPWAYCCSPLLKDYRMAESSFGLRLLPFGSEQMYGKERRWKWKMMGEHRGKWQCFWQLLNSRNISECLCLTKLSKYVVLTKAMIEPIRLSPLPPASFPSLFTHTHTHFDSFTISPLVERVLSCAYTADF